jgi:hypothetical protein
MTTPTYLDSLDTSTMATYNQLQSIEIFRRNNQEARDRDNQNYRDLIIELVGLMRQVDYVNSVCIGINNVSLMVWMNGVNDDTIVEDIPNLFPDVSRIVRVERNGFNCVPYIIYI